MAAWRRPALAQRPIPRLGVLVVGTPDPAPFLRWFREGLKARGYTEGGNLILDVRSAQGDLGRLKAEAAGLVRDKVDVIVGYQTPTAVAAKHATDSIPIVMASAGDPVGTGLVASLARPGGNVTGMSAATAEAGGKCVQLLRDMLPAASRIGALCNVTDPFWKSFIARIAEASALLGSEIRPIHARGAGDLENAFAQTAGLNAVIVQPSLGTTRVADLALKRRLPAASPNRPFAVAGGLLSYSGNQPAMFREAAGFVDEILKGAKPADLPVQQPTTFDLIVNAKTAIALGITVPPSLLARADEVIE